MSSDLRIVLVGEAKQAHDQMLKVARADGKTSINSSKLINWIVLDFFKQSFQRRKQQLCKDHFNSRKCVLEAMRLGDPEEMRRALQEAAKNIAAPKLVREKRKAKTDDIGEGVAPELK